MKQNVLTSTIFRRIIEQKTSKFKQKIASKNACEWLITRQSAFV